MWDKLQVGHFIYHLSNAIYFFKVQVVTKSFTCPRKKILLVRYLPLYDQIVGLYYCQRECIKRSGV